MLRRIIHHGLRLPRKGLNALSAAVRNCGIPVSANDLRLRLMKDRHLGQTCFILGSGPSMKMEYLPLLKDHNTFAFNQIFKVFDKTDWRPTYYVIGDSLIAENHRANILKIDKSLLFVSEHIKKILNDREDIIYFRKSHELELDIEPRFSTNAFKVVEGGFTVTFLAMQLAYYLGFREIYLLGVDNNYAPSNIDVTEKVGPYRVIKADHSKSYFIPNMVTDSERVLMPPDPKVQRLAYRSARKFFERNDVRIFNGALDSPLDIFPHRDFRLALTSKFRSN